MKSKIFLILAISFVFLGCKKKNEPKPKPTPSVVEEKGQVINKLEVKSAEIDATDYNKWVYFSFKTGSVVEVEDPMNDMSWDVAFKRSYVKSNGGTSGKGMASAMETPFKTFEEVVPSYMKTLEKDFKVDEIIGIPVDPNQDGNIQMKDESLNKELNKGIGLIIRQTNAPLIKYSERIYYFRSANGQYGTIKFVNYLKEVDKAFELKGGYVTIEYQYPFEFSAE